MFKDIDIRFVNKEITPFGGLSLFFKMIPEQVYASDKPACVQEFISMAVRQSRIR